MLYYLFHYRAVAKADRKNYGPCSKYYIDQHARACQHRQENLTLHCNKRQMLL